ncbi:hypothetical protein HZH68_012625 [Vespula germanica]|uniref:Uncharacterized protein n=1 Tax=Vespula germanica TaxID=30212 RepID=A0A834MZJ0_VESGE|nr:hypothetical protein HZH68_012625 [Vespula germanica]
MHKLRIYLEQKTGPTELNKITAVFDCHFFHFVRLIDAFRQILRFNVNVVLRALKNLSEIHWQLVKKILRYLKDTINIGLFYRNMDNIEIYSDSDFARDKEFIKSTVNILQTRLSEMRENMPCPENEVMFQQHPISNVPKYVAQSMQNWLNNKNYKLLHWPAQVQI